MTRFSMAALAFLAGLSPLSAAAQTVDGTDPERIAGILRDMGYKALLTTDQVGDPKIESKANGNDFSIYFYGCDKGINCKAIQFAAGFDLADGTSLDVINDWNAKNRFGRAYLDDEADPFVELDVNLDFGGVTETNLRDTIDWWDVVMAAFVEHIGF